MAGPIILYNSDLSIFTGAYLVAHWGYGYTSPWDIIDTLERRADDSGIYDQVEILDHGSPGMASIGSKSTIAASSSTG